MIYGQVLWGRLDVINFIALLRGNFPLTSPKIKEQKEILYSALHRTALKSSVPVMLWEWKIPCICSGWPLISWIDDPVGAATIQRGSGYEIFETLFFFFCAPSDILHSCFCDLPATYPGLFSLLALKCKGKVKDTEEAKMPLLCWGPSIISACLKRSFPISYCPFFIFLATLLLTAWDIWTIIFTAAPQLWPISTFQISLGELHSVTVNIDSFTP